MLLQQAEGSPVPKAPAVPDHPSVPEQPPGTVEDDLFPKLKGKVNELATASRGYKRALSELQGSVLGMQVRMKEIKDKVAKLNDDADVMDDGIAAVQCLLVGANPNPEEALP